MPTSCSLFTVDHFAPVNDFTVLSDVSTADWSGILEAEEAQRFVGGNQIMMINTDLQR